MEERLEDQRKQIIVFVGCVIRDNKVLMVQRDEEECPDAHLKWELPGGKVNFGETPQQALVREFLEEAGVQIEVGNLLPLILTVYWRYWWGEQQTFVCCFTCKFVRSTQLLYDHHVKKVAWIRIDELDCIQKLPGTKEIIMQVISMPEDLA